MAGWKSDSGMGPNIPRSLGARQIDRALGPADRLERQPAHRGNPLDGLADLVVGRQDRKSTRLNSSHSQISYAVFCLEKKKYTSPTNHVLQTPMTPCV